MTLHTLSYTLTLLCALTSLAACGNPGEAAPPDRVVNVGFGEGTGCSQIRFPPDEPDVSVLSPPRFLLTTRSAQQSSTGQAQVRPGDQIEAEITVNSATRRVVAELTNAWAEDDVIDTAELVTSGNEKLLHTFLSDTSVRGRYYMRLTLCGQDCDERQVVFKTLECAEDREFGDDPCGINAPYERTVIEAGETVRVDDTCVDLGGTPSVGSGTVYIQ